MLFRSREKATSNICTAQVLLAVMASMYAVYHGPAGVQSIANRVTRFASRLAGAAEAGGLTVRHESFFDTVGISAPNRANHLHEAALRTGFNVRLLDQDSVSVTFDEASTETEFQALTSAWRLPNVEVGASKIPEALRRTEPFLPHPVFHEHRSETSMMRYLRRLADKDLALDRTMIPLGSCTMKLNAAAEMEPITWPEFADVHPFAPAEQVQIGRAHV